MAIHEPRPFLYLVDCQYCFLQMMKATSPSISKSTISRSIFKPPPSTSWEKFRADPKLYLAHKFQSDNDQALKASPPHKASLTIVCISDTHTLEPDLPGGDLLLHAGDLTNAGSFDEMQRQLDWLNRQSHKHKVVIAGKADFLYVLISIVQTVFLSIREPRCHPFSYVHQKSSALETANEDRGQNP